MLELPNTVATDAPRVETEESKPIEIDSQTESTTAKDELPALIGGKFKSVDDLLNSYKNLETKLGETTTKFKEFEAPDDYTIELELPEQATLELKEMAKEANLSQSQFNRLLNKLHTKQVAARQQIDDAITNTEKEIGMEKLRKLDNYVEQSYPKSIAEAMKREYRLNKDVADQFYQVRERALSRVLPTDGSVGNYDDSARKKEMLELADKISTDPKAAKRFQELAVLGAQRRNSV